MDFRLREHRPEDHAMGAAQAGEVTVNVSHQVFLSGGIQVNEQYLLYMFASTRNGATVCWCTFSLPVCVDPPAPPRLSMQRAPSDGSSSVQAVYAPMENARRSSRSSFQSSSSVGSNAGSVDGSAPPPPPNYARSSAPAPDRPTSSQAPSYRTMMALPSTSEEAPGAEGGGGGGGGAESSSLPPGWELRTTVDGKTCG